MATGDDQWCEELLSGADAREARAWLTDEPERLRTLGEFESREESLELIEKAYATGALRVTAVEIDEYPDMAGAQNTGSLVVTLPHDPELRAKVFAWVGELAEFQGYDRETDRGQSYLYLMLD